MPKNSKATFSLIILLFSQQLLSETSGQLLENCKDAVTSQGNQESITVCEQQLSQTIEHEALEEAAFIRLELASLYEQRGDYSASSNWLKQVKQSDSFSNNSDIQYSWNRKMGLNLLHQTQYLKAEEFLQKAYQLTKKTNDSSRLAKSSNDLGLIYYKQKNYRDALLYYKESLKLKEELGNHYLVGTTLNNLGLLNKDLENYNKAITYYEQALDQFLKYTEKEGFDHRVFTNISHLYEDLAVTYSLANHDTEGERYTQRIINTFSRKLAQNDKVRALKNLALVLVEQKQPNKAQPFIEEAEHYATGDSKYIAEIDYIKAEIAFLLEQYEESRYLLKQSIPLAKNNNNAALLEKSYRLLHKMDLKEDKLEEALQHLTLSYQYKEQSLENQYQSDLQIIQEQIEKERVERRLIAEKLKSEQQSNQIQSLSNTILIISLLLVVLASIAAFVIYRKIKEKQRLLDSIKTHKEKVLLLESEHETDSQEIDSQEIGSQETGPQKDAPQEKDAQDKEDNLDFRQLLVELLIETLALWEKSTQTDRIELAEKSNIWKVSIDDGRLRTRSLDKYIDINKIPQNPRWRNVVKTSHYVLAECSLDNQERKQLEGKLDGIMALIKERSTSKLD